VESNEATTAHAGRQNPAAVAGMSNGRVFLHSIHIIMKNPVGFPTGFLDTESFDSLL
jgi:hypothetical protein